MRHGNLLIETALQKGRRGVFEAIGDWLSDPKTRALREAEREERWEAKNAAREAERAKQADLTARMRTDPEFRKKAEELRAARRGKWKGRAATAAVLGGLGGLYVYLERKRWEDRRARHARARREHYRKFWAQ